jgi:2-methylcitrate dehydratase PrpD
MVDMGSGDELTLAFAGWAAGVRAGDLPAALVERARDAFIDTVAAILSGVEEPVTRAAAAVVREEAAAPRSTQLGTGLRSSSESAAFLNAISGHAIDYDDVSQTIVGHPSVVLLPAALAVAEAEGASGLELIAAYAVGFEVMARLSRALGPAHYARGWHATSTLGTLGAAAAASRLLGLDPSGTANALALAVSMAAGSKRNFGTMAKPFHAGHAARSGVNAARLAAAGLTGDRAAIEAPLGFLALYGGPGTSPASALEALGERWDLLESGVSVKKYPCCFAIHRAADAVLDLRSEGLRPQLVERVAIRAPVGAYSPLNRDWAETGLEGKFSMRYAIAAALFDGRLGLDSFTDGAVRRPEVRELMARVEWAEDPRIEGGDNPIEGGWVEVEVDAGGERLRRRVEVPLGAPGRPLDSDGLAAKFLDCARGVLGEAGAQTALERLRRADSLPAADLVAALVGSGASAAAR